MRKLYEYDIYDGDKGVIVANTYKGACRIFRKSYPDTPICGIDTNNYDSDVCSIREIDDLSRKSRLYVVCG